MSDAASVNRSPYRLTIPADLAHVAKVREWLGEVGNSIALADSRVFDVQVAVSEAVANGVEHASSEVDIVCWDLPDRLLVEVTNDGVFSPGIYKDREGRRRGLGLPIMATLADDVHFATLSGNRTRVSLTFLNDKGMSAGPAASSAASPAAGAPGARRPFAVRYHEAHPGLLPWLLSLPAVLLVAVVAVFAGLGISGTRESAALVTAFNTLFIVAALVVVAYLAARTYLSSGSRVHLPLLAGAVLLALAWFITGPLLTDSNAAVTVHNTLFAIGGLLFAVVGVVIWRKEAPPERRPPWWGVPLACGVPIVFVAAWSLLADYEHLPAFLTAEGGFTALRDVVLGVGVLAFALASVFFFLIHRQRSTLFAQFTGLSFAMFALALGASLLTGAHLGTPLSWAARVGTWIGGLYLLAGAITTWPGGAWLRPLERSLRETKDRYQALVDTNPDAVWIRVDGRFAFANAAAAKLLGYASGGDLIGREVEEVFHPDTRDVQRERWAQALAGAVSPAVEELFLRADGSTVAASVFRTRVEYEGRLGIQAVAHDITERKQAEEALKESEERFRLMFERHGEPMLLIEPDSGHISDANEAAVRFYGYPHEQLRTMNITQINQLPPDQVHAMRARAAALQQNTFVAPHRLAGGAMRWVEVHSSPVAVHGRPLLFSIVHDITERKEAEEALRESEERHRLLAEDNERLYRQQLNIAETLQLALLNIPSHLGPVRIGHLYRSATVAARVGGDFYDAFEVKGDKVAVLVGDVAGHGIEAARTATLVKDVVHAFTHQSLRPHQILQRTNALLVEKNLPGFVTLFMALLDTGTGLLRYASAGHPETLLRRAGGDIHMLGEGSAPLGVHPEARWKSSELEMGQGDLLFLYTDGVIETRRDGEFFGQQRLERLLRRKRVTVERLPHLVLDQLLAFSEGRLSDDVAVLALSLTGTPAGPGGSAD